MRRSDDLYELIWSLDKGEKRYFKLFASKYKSKEDNHYLKLFHFIDKQKKYDPVQLDEKLKENRSFPNLAADKYYLYNLILKSLRSFHDEKNTDFKLVNDLQEAFILFQKGLDSQCLSLIKNAKKLALGCEKFTVLSALLELEYKIISKEAASSSVRKEMVVLLEEITQVNHKIQNLHAYRKIFMEMLLIEKERGVARNNNELEFFKTAEESSFIADEKNVQSFTARYYRYQVNRVYYRNKGDFDTLLGITRKQLETFESNPVFIEENIHDFLTTFNRLLLCLLGSDLDKEFFEAVERYKNISQVYAAAKSPGIMSEIFSTYTTLEMGFYLRKNEYVAGAAQADKIILELPAHETIVPKENELLLYFQFVITYLSVGDYRNALKWANKILNEPQTDFRNDLFCWTRILNLIIHYELKNNDLIEYDYKSATRFLKKSEKLFKLESVFLDFFKKVVNTSNEKESNSLLLKLRGDLDMLRKDPYEGRFLESFFDFSAWVDTKIQGKAFKMG